MMKERPINVSDSAMIHALISGSKTQDRRPVDHADMSDGVGPQRIWAQAVCPARVSGWIAWYGQGVEPGERIDRLTKKRYDHGFPCPYGQVGDRLWVREPLRRTRLNDLTCYAADNVAVMRHGKWAEWEWRQPATLTPTSMPRWASRITLEITALWVEHVGNMTPINALACGYSAIPCPVCDEVGEYDGAVCEECDGEGRLREVAHFRYDWDNRYANPWAWAFTFRRV